MKTKTKISLSLLTYIVTNDLIKAFALFLKVKATFKYTAITNYSHARLAKRFGLSEKFVERMIGKLLKHKFVMFQGSSLVFRNQSKIAKDLGILEDTKKDVYYTVETRPYTTIKGFINRILFILMKANANQQLHNEKKHGRHATQDGKKTVTKREEEEPFYQREGYARVFFSSRQLGRLWFVSNVQAMRILRKLEKLGYLKFKEIVLTEKDRKVEKVKRALSLNSFFDFRKVQHYLNENLPGYWHWKEGLRLHEGLKIEFQF